MEERWANEYEGKHELIGCVEIELPKNRAVGGAGSRSTIYRRKEEGEFFICDTGARSSAS